MEDMQELLAKLRVAKDAKAMSYQDIVDRTEENGECVSLSTVKRMFQKDANLSDFRYHQTVRPVIRAVLGLDEETEAPAEEPSTEQAEQYYATIEGLKALVDLKQSQLTTAQSEADRLRVELDSFKADQKREVQKVEAEQQKKIDYLKKIIDDLQGATKWYKRVIAILAVVAFLFFATLIVDLSIGNFGWIRY